LRFKLEDSNILLVTSLIEKTKKERWRVVYITKDIKDATLGIDVKVGDVVMSLLDQNNKVIYIRQLRKIFFTGGK